MSDDGPIRVLVGAYEIGTHNLTIPASVLRAADDAILAERERRRVLAAEAEAARLAEAARRRSLWGRIRAMFGGVR